MASVHSCKGGTALSLTAHGSEYVVDCGDGAVTLFNIVGPQVPYLLSSQKLPCLLKDVRIFWLLMPHICCVIQGMDAECEVPKRVHYTALCVAGHELVVEPCSAPDFLWVSSEPSAGLLVGLTPDDCVSVFKVQQSRGRLIFKELVRGGPLAAGVDVTYHRGVVSEAVDTVVACSRGVVPYEVHILSCVGFPAAVVPRVISHSVLNEFLVMESTDCWSLWEYSWQVCSACGMGELKGMMPARESLFGLLERPTRGLNCQFARRLAKNCFWDWRYLQRCLELLKTWKSMDDADNWLGGQSQVMLEQPIDRAVMLMVAKVQVLMAQEGLICRKHPPSLVAQLISPMPCTEPTEVDRQKIHRICLRKELEVSKRVDEETNADLLVEAERMVRNLRTPLCDLPSDKRFFSSVVADFCSHVASYWLTSRDDFEWVKSVVRMASGQVKPQKLPFMDRPKGVVLLDAFFKGYCIGSRNPEVSDLERPFGARPGTSDVDELFCVVSRHLSSLRCEMKRTMLLIREKVVGDPDITADEAEGLCVRAYETLLQTGLGGVLCGFLHRRRDVNPLELLDCLDTLAELNLGADRAEGKEETACLKGLLVEGYLLGVYFWNVGGCNPDRTRILLAHLSPTVSFLVGGESGYENVGVEHPKIALLYHIIRRSAKVVQSSLLGVGLLNCGSDDRGLQDYLGSFLTQGARVPSVGEMCCGVLSLGLLTDQETGSTLKLLGRIYRQGLDSSTMTSIPVAADGWVLSKFYGSLQSSETHNDAIRSDSREGHRSLSEVMHDSRTAACFALAMGLASFGRMQTQTREQVEVFWDKGDSLTAFLTGASMALSEYWALDTFPPESAASNLARATTEGISLPLISGMALVYGIRFRATGDQSRVQQLQEAITNASRNVPVSTKVPFLAICWCGVATALILSGSRNSALFKHLRLLRFLVCRLDTARNGTPDVGSYLIRKTFPIVVAISFLCKPLQAASEDSVDEKRRASALLLALLTFELREAIPYYTFIMLYNLEE